jgi:HEAT repeat protein
LPERALVACTCSQANTGNHHADVALDRVARCARPQSQASLTDGDALARARAHYARVAQELRLKDDLDLAPDALARRRALLAELDRYRAVADFTRGSADGARVPVFVDDEGRHCAVANLLRFCGETELVRRVAAGDNHAWVWDLRADPDFAVWLERVGLTFDEAARVQYPGTPPVPPIDPDVGGPWGTGGSRSDGPATPGPAPLAPATPGALGVGPATPQPASSLPGASRPTTEANGGEAFTDWGLWWEFNKLQWLRPQALSSVSQRDDDISDGESTLAAARRSARERLLSELRSSDASVRAAAAVAYARAAGPAALPALKPLLADRARSVRLAALAALAATGSEKGVHALLEVVHADEEPGPGLRAAAIVLLGAARGEGHGAGVAAMLPSLLRDAGDDETYALLAAAAFGADEATLAEAKRRSELFEETRARSDEPPQVRARATEALGKGESADVLSALLDALNGRDVGTRRSAALALGEVPAALAPLMTGYEGESEPLARGFALLSIGRHGGADARDFLARELEHGPVAMRPWCALALGILAERDDDAEACALLRAAYPDENVRSARGAYLLAMGIGRDTDAADLLIAALAAKDAPTRAHAALGLGLIGGERARTALRTVLVAETTPIVRTSAAQALALQHQPADADVLLRELASARSPLLRAQVAAALGLHGTPEAVHGLLAALEGDGLAGESRAAACAGLAVALSGRDRIALGTVSAWSDYTAFPTWLLELLQQPL